MRIDADSGTEGYIQWAKARLATLAMQRRDLNLPVMKKHFNTGSVQVDITSSEFNDMIRISGGTYQFGFVIRPTTVSGALLSPDTGDIYYLLSPTIKSVTSLKAGTSFYTSYFVPYDNEAPLSLQLVSTIAGRTKYAVVREGAQVETFTVAQGTAVGTPFYAGPTLCLLRGLQIFNTSGTLIFDMTSTATNYVPMSIIDGVLTYWIRSGYDTVYHVYTPNIDASTNTLQGFTMSTTVYPGFSATNTYAAPFDVVIQGTTETVDSSGYSETWSFTDVNNWNMQASYYASNSFDMSETLSYYGLNLSYSAASGGSANSSGSVAVSGGGSSVSLSGTTSGAGNGSCVTPLYTNSAYPIFFYSVQTNSEGSYSPWQGQPIGGAAPVYIDAEFGTGEYIPGPSTSMLSVYAFGSQFTLGTTNSSGGIEPNVPNPGFFIEGAGFHDAPGSGGDSNNTSTPFSTVFGYPGSQLLPTAWSASANAAKWNDTDYLMEYTYTTGTNSTYATLTAPSAVNDPQQLIFDKLSNPKNPPNSKSDIRLNIIGVL